MGWWLGVVGDKSRRVEIHDVATSTAVFPATVVTEPKENSDHWVRDYKDRHMDLVKLSQVSSRWLSIVLGCPRLWAYIRSDDSLKKTELFLSRSKECPLVISWRSVQLQHEMSFIDAIIPHASRWRILQATMACPNRLQFISLLSKLTSCPAPLMTRFMISFRGFNPVPLTEFFAGHTPNLRHLHLGSMNVPWNSKLIAGLTSLEVTSPRETTLDQYRLLLEANPKLQWLCILGEPSGGSYNSTAETSPSSASAISLMDLEFIRLGYLPAVVTWFLLSSIITSPECATKINAYRIQEVEAMVPQSSSQSSLLSRIGSSTWLCLSGEERDSMACVHCGVGEVYQPDPPNYTLQIYGFQQSRLSLWKVLLPPDRSTLITSISLSCMASGVQEIVGVLCSCRDLEDLMLYDIQRDTSVQPALTALSLPPDSDKSSLQWPCPRLKQILVQGLTSHRAVLELIEARYGISVTSEICLPAPLKQLVIRRGQNSSWVQDAEIINRLMFIVEGGGGQLILQHEVRTWEGIRIIRMVPWNRDQKKE